MQILKRIGFFLLTNIAVLTTITIIVSLLEALGIKLYNDSEFYAFIVGMSSAIVSLFLSKWSAKFLSGLIMIEEDEKDQRLLKIRNMVKKIIEKTDIKMPEVGYYVSDEINAFATGAFRNSSLIGVSTGLIEKMTDEEIEGVLAHEVSHITNGDMITLTLIQGVVNSFIIYVSRIISKMIPTENKILQEISYFLIQIALGILLIPVVNYFSRIREYKADEGSAKLVGKNKIIAALNKLKAEGETEENSLPKELVTAGINGKQNTLFSLFATHPSLEKRIENLKRLNNLEL